MYSRSWIMSYVLLKRMHILLLLGEGFYKCRVDRIEELYLGNQEEEIHELLIDDKNFVNEDIKI